MPNTPEKTGDQPTSEMHNVPIYSVSEISGAVKQVVEDSFSYVRIRGELSKVNRNQRSGHMYFDLKDENSLIAGVCWKGVASRLTIQPEEGMEVIATGKISTFAGSSKYQIIISSIELAGQGALLKMLEERKKKLASEGLFDPARKKDLPFLPNRIGVITSPTGAVIRDIMHRLNDRFPRPVTLWPASVQGVGAAELIAAAIHGFNKLPADQRPDLLIVARGGGSIEDLMPFNEEVVVRAAAASNIPLISAVGHETDTTLIDHAADVRAPTPTAAAEIAVPVRADLLAFVMDCGRRNLVALQRLLADQQRHFINLTRNLNQLKSVADNAAQKFDGLHDRFRTALKTYAMAKDHQLSRLKLMQPTHLLSRATQALTNEARALKQSITPYFTHAKNRFDSTTRLLETLSYKQVLERGFALVQDTDGQAVTRAKNVQHGQTLSILFADDKVAATAGEGAPPPQQQKTQKPKLKKKPQSTDQGSLF